MSIAVKTADGWQVLGVGGDGDCELVGGVAGWAAIESVTGTADLATLQAANIAPATATEDLDCGGTYNIVGDDGVVYRVAVWTGDGSIQTSTGIVDCLLVGAATHQFNGGNVREALTDISANGTVTIGVYSGDNVNLECNNTHRLNRH